LLVETVDPNFDVYPLDEGGFSIYTVFYGNLIFIWTKRLLSIKY
jgi:hypothetical protein